MSITALRTDDRAFENLPSYPFTPHYTTDLPGYEGLRMHYLDEGPRDARVSFLCLHGQPTWSYLYRTMIPVFSGAGHRVIAPDWFGFGRSDKPVDEAAYSFEFHRGAMVALVEHLNLGNVVLVCQDWGGLLGLTIPMLMPARFTRLLVMNTALATGEVRPNAAFYIWRTYSNLNPNMNVGGLLRFSCRGISRAESEAYNAPFPDVRFKAGVRRFPRLVPTSVASSAAQTAQQAARGWREDWRGESFMAVGMRDPILGPGAMRVLRSTIRDCPPPLEVAHAGHFVQEDAGAEVAAAALRAFKLERT
jgi:pimeloyl-ACP methyl ester carboxylesterase